MIIYRQPNETISNELVQACKDGDLNLVKYLLTSPNLHIHADINYKDGDAFTNACEKGHLHIVKYLLTSPDLKTKIDVNSYNSLGFVIACENNHTHLIKYFLTSPDLKVHADIHSYSNYALREICKRGYIELLDYLTTSDEIEERYQKADWPIGFNEACAKKQYHIIRFFIFNLGYEITDEELEKLPQEIKNMFELRLLNAKLKYELKINKEKTKIVKI